MNMRHNPMNTVEQLKLSLLRLIVGLMELAIEYRHHLSQTPYYALVIATGVLAFILGRLAGLIFVTR